MLVLLFTFARSETPCCKTYTSFDPTQHLMLSDVRPETAAQPYLKVRLKTIKQDHRMERLSAASGEDWIVVGDLADSNCSVFLWLRRLFGFFAARGPRDPLSPFSVSEEFVRPLRYCDAMINVRIFWKKVVGLDVASRYGLHSLRVTGYNSVRVADLQLAVAQGGWRADAHERYARISVANVLRNSRNNR
eukprot:4375517-Pleurochrysis_carterae.AAC.1